MTEDTPSLFEFIQPANPSGFHWTKHWTREKGNKLGRRYQLWHGTKLLEIIDHCGHPTALHPWYFPLRTSQGHPLETFDQIGHAQEYALRRHMARQND